nr:hypothetical protein [uncultured Sulfurimonas sp.]
MKKTILILFILLLPLYANSVTQNELNGIYKEAILFVAVFGIMAIVSYIYSTKHAKEYKSKKRVVKEKSSYDKRVEQLLDLYEKKLLNRKEFELLKDYYLH